MRQLFYVLRNSNVYECTHASDANKLCSFRTMFVVEIATNSIDIVFVLSTRIKLMVAIFVQFYVKYVIISYLNESRSY